MSPALGALVFLVLSPVAAQTAFLQEPGGGTNGNHAASSDIRLIHRSTTGGNQGEVPPGMVLVTGGKVVVGTPREEVEALGQRDVIYMTEILAETPRHTAEVEAFLIDVTEVTNLQWKVFLEATGREPSPILLEVNWPGGEIPSGQDDFPITNVNIPEIRQFMQWCGKRLPTEQEWTRAARGDDERGFPWGSAWDAKKCQSGMNVPQQPVKVGSFPGGASPFGALDMLGNVFEWVDSPFRAFDGYESMPYGAGRQKLSLVPEFNSTYRVIKGGAFTTNKQFTRIDVRLGAGTVSSDHALGFRAARSLTTGVEAIQSAMGVLVPPYFMGDVGLDEKDVFAKEETSYDTRRKVITGYRHVSFAHRAPTIGTSWSKLYRESRDEFLPLGVLATSETLRMDDMDIPAFPAGEYTLHFKAEGESKAWKEKEKLRKETDKAAKKDGGRGSKDDEPAETAEGTAPDGSSLPASVPWPGVASIHDIAEDIPYPQDTDLILLMNSSNKVVGYIKPNGSVKEAELAPISVTESEGGKAFQVDFTLDQNTGKRSPRFSFTLRLAGDAL
jgi:formylglycine-generating enzyme required for sulfatase activity